MIINKIKSYTTTVFFAVLVAVCCFSCDTDLYETYEEYSGGDVVSVAKPDSVIVVQGDERLFFSIYLNADPKLKKGFITWNNGEDEYSFDIDRTVFKNEKFEIELAADQGLTEYTIYLEDGFGKKSINTLNLVEVLGENYRKSLTNRSIQSVALESDSEALITLESNRVTIISDSGESETLVVNDLLVSTEITYTSSVDSSVQTIVVDESEDTVVIPNFESEGVFTYKTTYKAAIGSPDNFITDEAEGNFPVIL